MIPEYTIAIDLNICYCDYSMCQQNCYITIVFIDVLEGLPHTKDAERPEPDIDLLISESKS